MLDTLKFGFIGGGNMASALIGGLIARGAKGANIVVVDPTEPARAHAAQTWGATAAAAPGAELADRDVIVLAVKPQQMREVCAQLAPHLRDSLVLSVAAGIRIQDLSRWLNGHARIVRAMPNTPALSGQGMTGLAANDGLAGADRDTSSAIANAVGKSVWVPSEAQIDAVTAISGSGPAYVFYFIEAMQQAAQELGLSAEAGRLLAAETFIGAATLAGQSSEPVELLRERVTSKGGTTYAAITAMDTAGIKPAFVRAMHAAAARSKEMGEAFGHD
ncbi:pyrroline-5-carboxylate reductase [Ralstonia syzygii]|uniref:pyrroline-5-carboxylate reductase n=1 Tax=Ralstonia syzygii TaxID=28097 RepID=UPI0018D06696|nr:pyrroline-5-carboxylate reductase [Ralstonia syzygii]CAH0447483.1 Pyrroline-5-carboxylate reductase [Ralstonia syzygii subsp. syzygii]